MIPQRFVTKYGTYTFPAGLTQDIDPRFGGIAASVVRLPGTDGGIDQYGDGIAPGEIGSVRVTFGLLDETGLIIDQLRDAVMAMAVWGKGMLVAQPTLTGASERYCWARIDNITIPEKPSGLTELIQLVTVDFQVSAPRWYVNRFARPRWGFGAVWGGTDKWGGSASAQACAGTLTTLSTITNSGIAVALPKIQISLAAGQSAEDVTLERIDGIEVADQIIIDGVLAAGDVVEIDCRAASVLKNYADAYSALDALYPDWMALWPGANVLQVRMANASDACSVRITYEDTYL